MGDPFKPQAMPTKRNKSDDAFAGILRMFIDKSMQPVSKAAPPATILPGSDAAVAPVAPTATAGWNDPRMPGSSSGSSQWQAMSPGAPGVSAPSYQAKNAAAIDAMPFDDLGSWIADTFQLPGYEGELATPMTGVQTEAMATGRAAGAHGRNAMDRFFSAGGPGSSIESSLLEILADKGDGPVAGPTATPESLYAALEPQRRANMARTLGQMEEEFGMSGLSGSTSLYESGARAETESQGNLLAEVSRMAPQLEALKLEAQGMGDARKANARSGAMTAAQLLASIPQMVAGRGMEMAQGEFNLGEGERAIGDMELERRYNEFLRQQSLFPQILSYLAGTPAPAYAPSMFDNLLKGGMGAASMYTGFTG